MDPISAILSSGADIVRAFIALGDWIAGIASKVQRGQEAKRVVELINRVSMASSLGTAMTDSVAAALARDGAVDEEALSDLANQVENAVRAVVELLDEMAGERHGIAVQQTEAWMMLRTVAVGRLRVVDELRHATQSEGGRAALRELAAEYEALAASLTPIAERIAESAK